MLVRIKLVGLLLLICNSYPYITRIPNCKYYAKFTRQKDRYYQVAVATTIADCSVKKCLLSCIASDDCLFVNYKKVDKKCEIIDTNDGNAISLSGWEIISTDYGSSVNIGSICENYKPCPEDMYCQDTCDEPGFICIDTNVAPRGTATQSTLWSTAVASYANDGDITTQATTGNSGHQWWQVDLRKSYPITFVKVHIGSTTRYATAKLEIGDTIPTYQLIKTLGNGDTHKITCNRNGRFVRIFYPKADYMHLWEVKVFVDLKDY